MFHIVLIQIYILFSSINCLQIKREKDVLKVFFIFLKRIKKNLDKLIVLG